LPAGFFEKGGGGRCEEKRRLLQLLRFPCTQANPAKQGMGNCRSKAKATAVAGVTAAAAAGGAAAAAASLDDSGSSKNNGKKKSPSSSKQSKSSSIGSGSGSNSSKKQGKAKQENGKNVTKQDRKNSHLACQDSRNRAILQHHQQQEALVLHRKNIDWRHMATLARQDSYNKAILQHQQQEALVLYGATATAAVAFAAAAAVEEEEAIPAEPRSMHARLVRSRDGEQQPVHQIYDVINEIGHGGLCKVFCIQKKQEYIGGTSRPHNVRNSSIDSSDNTSNHSSGGTAMNNKSNKWLMKIQSLGTITIRARTPPLESKKQADDDAVVEKGDGDSSGDPWNLPELRFLFCHNQHHRDSSNAMSANDDSASSDRQKRQQQQQQPTTASPPIPDDVATATTAALAAPSSSSLSLSTSTNGDGIRSTVNPAIPSANKPMYFALKVINLVMVQEDKIAQLKNEVEILKTLDHPNIIKVYESFNTKRQVMMIMELCTGGDLSSRMPYMDTDTELQVADIMRQILSAIRYIHSRHIVHRGEFC
jgi:Protein kinase domain